MWSSGFLGLEGENLEFIGGCQGLFTGFDTLGDISTQGLLRNSVWAINPR